MSKDKRNDGGKSENPNSQDEVLLPIVDRKEAIKLLGQRYVDWFDKSIVNFKTFWLKEFVYPIVSPTISLAIFKYLLNYNFTKEQSIILFMVFYAVTFLGRLLGKYKKLVDVLDPLIDEIKEIKDKGVNRSE